MFDQASLEACRRKAISVDFSVSGVGEQPMLSRPRPRKFASGFHHVHKSSHGYELPPEKEDSLSTSEQELLVRFHAHQIQSLVGPAALLPGLYTSETVVLTAVALFRRFYLSNSVVEVNPRKVAVASAFLASKVEEERIDIALLAHATAEVTYMVQHAPLCRQELCAVPVEDIEVYERILMEGVNYEFRCHHPNETLHALASSLFTHLSNADHGNDTRDPVEGCYCDQGAGERSPRGTLEHSDFSLPYTDETLEQALELSQLATIFSDVLFLCEPDHTALAIMSLVRGSVTDEGGLDAAVIEFIRVHYPAYSDEERKRAVLMVNAALGFLLQCPLLNLRRSSPNAWQDPMVVSRRADALRHVLGKVSHLRILDQMRRHDQTFFLCSTAPPPQPPSRKRTFVECYYQELSSTPYPRHYRQQSHHRLHRASGRRVVRVTPNSLPR